MSTERSMLEREPSGSHCSTTPERASLKARAPILRACVALLALAACGHNPVPEPIHPGDPGPNNTPPPIPLDGPIMYNCDNGQQIVVDVEETSARVQIVGGTSMVLPRAGEGYYSNGRYGFRGGGASGQWEVGRAAPANCTGG